MNNFEHKPVLANEVIELLNIKLGGIYIDGTLGGGGHSGLIAERLSSNGRIIGIDQDKDAIESAKIYLEKFGKKIIYQYGNFADLQIILTNMGIGKVDGILLDLGVSSYQIDNLSRGFSFRESDENFSQLLDMRMDQSQDFSARNVLEEYSEEKLRKIFYTYGEEPFSRQIARKIMQARILKQVSTVGDLMEIIRSATPPKYRYSKGGGNYASKIFRAIRMEVNDELDVVSEIIPQAIHVLKPGGRLLVITFHSLEDRIVKHAFRDLANVDNPEIKLITKRAIVADEEELVNNSRANSAKLRVIEKI